jgi:hypothetical protein
MAGTWTSKIFPQFEKQLRNLTKQHLELEDEPLHLAISYAPKRDQRDIFLFEVIGGNGGDYINPDKELVETTFPSSPGFPMAAGQQLHLVLTNQRELELALSEGWPSVREVVDAIQSNDYKKLYADKTGGTILKRLAESGHMEGAARG